MSFYRRFNGVAVALCLAVAGCSLPNVMGMGNHYEVTDINGGAVYYTDHVSREKRGVVEFKDARTGAWVSLASADIKPISQSDFRKAVRP